MVSDLITARSTVAGSWEESLLKGAVKGVVILISLFPKLIKNEVVMFRRERIVAGEIEQLMCILDLDDVWRTLHPDEKQFTLRRSDLKILK